MLRFTDWITAPLVLLFLLFLVRIKYRRVSIELKKYVYPSFLLRIVGSIFYTIVVSEYYGFGDSHNYYQGVLDLHRAIDTDISFLSDIYSKWKLEPSDRLYPYFYFDGTYATHFYMQEVRTYNVSRLALPLSLLTNKSFLGISFVISYFSFLGAWQLTNVFYDLYPKLYRKIALVTLFLPSHIFWSTSLLKDSFCLFALGYFTHSIYHLFVKNNYSLNYLLRGIASSMILLYLKPYILVCITAVFSIWFFSQYRAKIKDLLLRRLSTWIFILMSLTVSILLVGLTASSEAASQFKTESIISSVNVTQQNFQNIKGEGSSSNFVGANTTSFYELVLNFPQGVVNTYFRPFFWDVRSPIALFSAFEAFLFLLMTIKCIRCVGMGEFLVSIYSTPVIGFCFLFAIIFGGTIGLTTTNFGALTRYKIPALSFYAMTIILIMDRSSQLSKKYIFSRHLF